LNSGVTLAKQALYHLSTLPALFGSVMFQIGSCAFAGLSWTTVFLPKPPL
jgi:hypothetical protein